VDENGNWVGGDDTEREAAWAEYYKEYGQPTADNAEVAEVAEVAEAAAPDAPTAQ
jgi:hypothetical protein